MEKRQKTIIKTRRLIFIFAVTVLLGFNIFAIKANASGEIGGTFTVSNITYRVKDTVAVEVIDTHVRLTNVTIPSTVVYNGVTYSVTGLSKEYTGNGRMTKLTLSEGIKSVDASSLQYCRALTEIVLPSTLESFTTMGFANLKSISLAAGNSHFQLKDGVLFSKDGTKLWLYPSGRSGTSYTVPSGTTTIVAGAFYENQHLQTITLPSSVTTIKDYAFYAVNELTSMTFGSNVSSVGDYNLYSCPNLRTVTLKNSGVLGWYTINNCRSLEKIIIDGNTNGYGVYSLYNLPNLKEYDVRQSPYYHDKEGVLYNKNSLLRYPSGKATSQYIVPDGTVKITGLAFNHMQHTEEIILNSGVNVDVMAFHYPNKNSALDIYFRDKKTVSMSTSSSGVFVGLNSGSNIYLPTSAAVNSFNSYGKAINSEAGVTVTVSQRTIPATGIELNTSSANLRMDETTALTVTLTPYYSTDDITWSSSNPSVATVSSTGVVKAISKGKCFITAKTGSGVSKKCELSVTAKTSDVPENSEKDYSAPKDELASGKDESVTSDKGNDINAPSNTPVLSESTTDEKDNEKKEETFQEENSGSLVENFSEDEKKVNSGGEIQEDLQENNSNEANLERTNKKTLNMIFIAVICVSVLAIVGVVVWLKRTKK